MYTTVHAAKGSVNTPCHHIVVSFLIDLSAVPSHGILNGLVL